METTLKSGAILMKFTQDVCMDEKISWTKICLDWTGGRGTPHRPIFLNSMETTQSEISKKNFNFKINVYGLASMYKILKTKFFFLNFNNEKGVSLAWVGRPTKVSGGQSYIWARLGHSKWLKVRFFKI